MSGSRTAAAGKFFGAVAILVLAIPGAEAALFDEVPGLSPAAQSSLVAHFDGRTGVATTNSTLDSWTPVDGTGTPLGVMIVDSQQRGAGAADLITYDGAGRISFDDTEVFGDGRYLRGFLTNQASTEFTVIWLGHYEPDAPYDSGGTYMYNIGLNEVSHQRDDDTGIYVIQLYNGTTYSGDDITPFDSIDTVWSTVVTADSHTAWANNINLNVEGDPAYSVPGGAEIVIGAFGAGGFDVVGDLLHLIIFESALDDTDRILIEDWLGSLDSRIVTYGSTMSDSDKFAYAANGAWINFRHDQPRTPDGLVVRPNWLAGFAYSANLGWIKFGDGSPDNGIAYANDSEQDFGINHDGAGNLTGFAYGANVGWIKFEQVFGQPRIDLLTGAFSGYAYSANCGWINLGTGTLVTDSIEPGPDSDGDQIADSWELEQGSLNGMPGDLNLLGATSDLDGDGVSDRDEYLADTNPYDDSDNLRILSLGVTNSVTDNMTIVWTSSARRLYTLLGTGDPALPFGPHPLLTDIQGEAEATERSFTNSTEGANFFRVSAHLPLAPIAR